MGSSYGTFSISLRISRDVIQKEGVEIQPCRDKMVETLSCTSAVFSILVIATLSPGGSAWDRSFRNRSEISAKLD